MVDTYLAHRLAHEFPWVPNVYRETSGFIHLSEKHILSTHGRAREADRSVETCISGRDFKIDDGFRLEAIQCMSEISSQVLRYVYGWAHTKDVARASEASPSSQDNVRPRERPSESDGEEGT